MWNGTEALVASYASLFVGRWDCYAVQQRNGTYACIKQSLSLPLLASHLAGRVTLGTYVLNRDSTCTFAVFDDDREDGLYYLGLLAGELAQQGVSTLLEASRRGGHLWVFFSVPTPGTLVRAWLLPYAEGFGLELYPKQDALAPGGYGSLVRLPLGIHRKSRAWYPFVEVGDWDFPAVGNTIDGCLTWVAQSAQRVVVSEALSGTGIQQACLSSEAMLAPSSARSGPGAIAAWCRTQDITAVIGQYVALDRRGVGSCPFSEHHYRGDLRPSFQVFGGSDPHWYCYTWRRAGNLFTFLCLYHGLTIQEGWERLQQGTLG